MRFLLLENDATFAQQLESQLLADSCSQGTRYLFSRYTDALQELRGQAFDAVFLDWQAGDDDRFSICRRLCAAGQMPLIAFTASEDMDEVVRIVEAGADDVLPRDEFPADYVQLRVKMAAERSRYAAFSRELTPAAEMPLANKAGPRTTSLSNSVLVKNPLSLLHVAPEPTMHVRLHPMLAGFPDSAIQVSELDSFESLPAQMESGSFDVVVVDVDETDINGLYAIEAVRNHGHQTTIVAITNEHDPRFSVLAMQRGADDCLNHQQGDCIQLSRSIRVSIARRQRRWAEGKPHGEVPYSENVVSAFPRAAAENRQNPRFFVTKSAIAIPVLPDFAPDRSLRAEGFTSDVSQSGLGFEVAGLDRLPSKLLLVGVEADDGNLYFATVEARNWTELPGRLRIGGRFVEAQRDLLRPENLMPMFQPKTQKFATGIPSETLFKWAELGIFRPVLVDRQFVCPKCGGLPTFRYGCRSCGSVHIASQQLLHHFACAYVGIIDEFEHQGEMICPKCRTRGLVVGADFEHLNGPYHCLDCNWSDTDTELVGDCIGCHWRFPFQQAGEEEMIGFHVNRLDPLALIGA